MDTFGHRPAQVFRECSQGKHDFVSAGSVRIVRSQKKHRSGNRSPVEREMGWSNCMSLVLGGRHNCALCRNAVATCR